MINKVKRRFKKALVKYIRDSKEKYLIEVAELVRHEYPPHFSLQDIVNDIKAKR